MLLHTAPLLKSILFTLFVTISFYSQAQTKNASSGFLDFNLYPYLSDVDNDTTFTLNIAANLPNRFSYFSLINLGNHKDKDPLEETINYYTEHNLRWKITEKSPLDLTVQLNFRTGDDNDRHRLGVRWRLSDTTYLKDFFKALNLSYAINLHLIQFDNEAPHVWQLEHSFFMKFPYISERLYLAGFADHTFNQDLPDGTPANPIVSEIQLGYRIVENLFLMSEYRINEYRRSDVNNLAVGLQYKMIW